MKLTNCKLLLCCAALSAYAALPSAPLFENGDVRVFRALEKAHVKGGFHEHKPNRVMVYLQAGKQRFEFQDGRAAKVFDWKPGQVVWSLADGMHSPEVLSDESFNIVEVELKKPGSGKAFSGRDGLKADSAHYSQEVDNDQVRVLRLKLPAHQSTPLVENAHNTVAVFVNDQEFSMTDAAGKSQAGAHKMGDAVWLAPGSSKLENTGSTALEMVLVELK